MIIDLNSETHPSVEVIAILLDKKTMDFQWIGTELKTAIEAVLGDVGE